jgi:hypothetical protein
VHSLYPTELADRLARTRRGFATMGISDEVARVALDGM